MDRTRVEALDLDLMEALEKIGEKHKVKFSHGTITFSGTDFRTTLKCFDIEASGGKGELQVAFERAAAMGRVPKSWFGKEIEFLQEGGYTTGRIIGFKPKSWKRPLVVEDASGKRWKFEIAMVRSLMKKSS